MSPQIPYAATALLTLAAAGPAVYAREAPELETVTVVGKLPQPLRDAAAAVSVIPAERIATEVAFELRDALRFEPGVSVARDPHRFGAGGVTIRGLGGNRVLVETDGVPAAKSFAVGSFSNTGRQFADLEIVRRIELLRGPASSLYGSDAIAGVLAVTTVDPVDLLEDGSGAALRTRVGHATDDGSSFAGLTGAMRSGPFESLLAVARREGDELDLAGGAPRSNPRDHRSDAVLGRTLFSGLGRPLRFTAEWNQDRARTDVDSLELSGGRFASTIFLEGDDRLRGLRLLLDQNLGAAGPFEAGLWRLYWNETQIRQFTREERRAAPPVAPPLAIRREFHYRERVTGAELALARTLPTDAGPHRLLAGLEASEARVTERRDGLQTDLTSGVSTSTILGEALPVRDFPNSRIREVGLYVQDEWRPGGGRWSVIPALRADWYGLDPVVDPMYAADNPSEPPVDIEQSSVSPKLGIGWVPREGVSLFLQYAHGFRSPPFDDVNIGLELPQFNTRAIPNPELEPERSDSLELGLRLSGAAVSGSASLFGSRYRDFIESRVNIGVEPGTGTLLFQSRNVARAEIVGAEAALDFGLGAWRRALEGWGGRLALSWTEGEDTARDRPLNSIDPPRAMAGLRFDTTGGRLGVALDLTMVAAKHGVDDSAGPLYRPGGCTLIDLRLRWRLHERVTANVGLFNLADRTYYEWATVRGGAADDPLLPLYREAGRNFAVTVTASLD